ncbi:MAG: hypothetical protein KatS3mg076_2706 [Candidatus Binatia bacterium]|nr:MAG: hypothetical protein KatS3mg076_2706 [Candidatus Binatia bacterium]
MGWLFERERPRTPGPTLTGGPSVLFGPRNSARLDRHARRAVLRTVVPMALLLLTLALVRVKLEVEVTELGYRLSLLRGTIEKLERENRELRLEVAAAESPARLRSWAVELGMRAPLGEESLR